MVWPRALRRMVVAATATLRLIVIVSAAGEIYLTTLPSVSNAERRIHAILGLNHGTYDGPAPPARLGAAVVAVEDEHFYANFLVNVRDGAGRATPAALRSRGDPGGSTIAQQLAKQLYGRGAGVGATLREIGLGVKLSLDYPKTQILDMYLNAVYFGHGYWGISPPPGGTFGRPPTRLTGRRRRRCSPVFSRRRRPTFLASTTAR